MEIREALTFDDVLLEPAASAVFQRDRHPHALTGRIELGIPLILLRHGYGDRKADGDPMAQSGGIGVIHKNLDAPASRGGPPGERSSNPGMVINPLTIHPERLRRCPQPDGAAPDLGFPVTERGSGKLVGILTTRDVRFASDRKPAVCAS